MTLASLTMSFLISDTDTKPDRCTAAIKVIDIFGNDTMTLVPVNVG